MATPRPHVTPHPDTSPLLRLRFPGAALSLGGAAVAVAQDSPVAAVLFGLAAVVFVPVIAVNARWDTSRALTRRDGDPQ